MLLRASPNEIVEMMRGMKNEYNAIEREIASVVYYMNGGLPLSDAYNLSMEQLEILADVISKHYEKQNDAIKNPKQR